MPSDLPAQPRPARVVFYNDPKVRSIAYQVALEVVCELRPLVEQIRKHDNTLAKQLVDAASE